MSRLPCSATRPEGRELNVKSDRLPSFKHSDREVEDYMEDIVYNAIDIIQDRSRDSDLRMFYFNLMSDRDYDNKDFEDLITMIGDIIVIAVSQRKFRDVRDAVLGVTEDVINVSVAWQVEEHPDLEKFVERDQERSVDKGISVYESYVEAIRQFKGGGRGRGRDRDRDRDDRGSRRGRNDRDDRDDRGSRGRPRRDQWERGAIRGGVRGSRRNNTDPLNGPNQETRYDDDEIVNHDVIAKNDNRRDERDERDERPRARVQRMPNSRPSDIDDALERERDEQKGSAMRSDREEAASEGKMPRLFASNEVALWFPSPDFPHPLAFSRNQDLMFDVDQEQKIIIPRVVDKDTSVNFHEHASMLFGAYPKELSRYENGDLIARNNTMHEALVNPTLELTVDEKPVTHRKMLIIDEVPVVSSLKAGLTRLSYLANATERRQINGDKVTPISIAAMRVKVFESFAVSPRDMHLLEELRGLSTYTKLAEKLRGLSKKLSPETFIAIDNHFRDLGNHILRQYLSIPALRMNSFSDTWLDLMEAVTNDFGEGFRDAININQHIELGKLMPADAVVEAVALSSLPQVEGEPIEPPFVLSIPTYLIRLNEMSHMLDLDILPGVASQLVPESTPFFHDLAAMVLAKDKDIARFYVQTTDLRVLELSRSWMSDTALLIRLIK